MGKLPIFIDSNLLSIFTEVSRLHMLITLFDGHGLHVSPAVHSELVTAVERGRNHIVKALELVEDGKIINITAPSPSEFAQLEDLPKWMALGEAECIVICQTRGGVFASFDRKATNYCHNHGIPYLTLNRVLTALWQKGAATKDEVRKIIEEIEQSGRRIRSAAEILQDD